MSWLGQLSRAKRVGIAIGLLQAARDQLRKAKAPNAANAVRRALKSTEGAYRHAERLPVPAGRRAAKRKRAGV